MQLMPPAFATEAAYERALLDVGYWRPYVEAVLARHGFSVEATVRMGDRGTYPVAVVDQRLVVKLFPRFHWSLESFALESDAYLHLAGHDKVPAPELVAIGELWPGQPGWAWPYLVTSALPGAPLGDPERLSAAVRRELAGWLGRVVRTLHALPVEAGRVLRPDWEGFDAFLTRQRAACQSNHARRRTLSPRLVSALDDWLPSASELVDRSSPPRLLHGDLHQGNILGHHVAMSFEPVGIIDFNDVKVGDPLYELPAVHLSVLGADVGLLGVFLEASGMAEALTPGFVRDVMAYTLLHDFDVLAAVADRLPGFHDATSLDDLAGLIWGEVRRT